MNRGLYFGILRSTILGVYFRWSPPVHKLYSNSIPIQYNKNDCMIKFANHEYKQPSWQKD